MLLVKTIFKKWTGAFNPSSTSEGNWHKGSEIHFIGVEENGKKVEWFPK
ncbi:hypothetical protein [Ignavibacterium sp.]